MIPPNSEHFLYIYNKISSNLLVSFIVTLVFIAFPTFFNFIKFFLLTLTIYTLKKVFLLTTLIPLSLSSCSLVCILVCILYFLKLLLFLHSWSLDKGGFQEKWIFGPWWLQLFNAKFSVFECHSHPCGGNPGSKISSN